MIDQLLLTLVPLEHGKVGESLTSNVDMKNKIKIALAIGFLKKPDDQWFDELKAVLDLADNELRAKRNRFAHDLFMFDRTSDAVKKLHFHTVLKKPQARKPLELTTLHETKVLPEEIWATADAIENAAGKIAILNSQHQMLTRRALRQKSP